jgi:hypothetical protein
MAPESPRQPHHGCVVELTEPRDSEGHRTYPLLPGAGEVLSRQLRATWLCSGRVGSRGAAAAARDLGLLESGVGA